MSVEKLCMECFTAEFPGRRPGTFTWGRQCARCRKETPSSAHLVKVDRAES